MELRVQARLQAQEVLEMFGWRSRGLGFRV